MSITRIAILTKHNPYETKRYFAEQFHQAILKKTKGKIESKIFDLNTFRSTEKLASVLLRYAPDRLLNFAGEILNSEKKLLWEQLKIPCWCMVYDPVWYHNTLIESNYSTISCVDQLDCDFLKQQKFNQVHFFPHAVPEDLIGYEERPYDLVFIGSYFNPDNIKHSWNRFGDSIYSEIIEEAAKLCLTQTGVNPAGAVILAAKNHDVSIAQLKFFEIVYLVDLYTRAVDRIRLIRSVKNHTIHIFGGSHDPKSFGWAQEFSLDNHVVVHPSILFSEAIEILKQAKICLNSTCKFKAGIHERILYSLACGAVPITTNNLFIPTQFNPGKELFLYDENILPEVNSIITDLLQNPAKRKEIAQQGRDKVMTHYTLDQWVLQLLKELE